MNRRRLAAGAAVIGLAAVLVVALRSHYGTTCSDTPSRPPSPTAKVLSALEQPHVKVHPVRFHVMDESEHSIAGAELSVFAPEPDSPEERALRCPCPAGPREPEAEGDDPEAVHARPSALRSRLLDVECTCHEALSALAALANQNPHATPTPITKVLTDSDGRAELFLPERPMLGVIVRKAGFRTALEEVELDGTDPIELYLSEKGALSFSVVNARHQRIHGAEVIALCEPLLQRLDPVEARGKFTFADPPDGWLTLLARAPGYPLQRITVSTQELEESGEVILDHALRVEGMVTAAGQPVAEAEVTTDLAGQPTSRTGRDGRFVLDDLDPDVRWIRARAGGLSGEAAVDDDEAENSGSLGPQVRRGSSSDVRKIHIKLIQSGALEVRVRDAATDGGISGATVSAFPRAHQEMSALTDSEGTAHFPQTAPGSVDLLVSAEGYAASSTSTEIEPGQLRVVPVELVAGYELSGRVLDANGLGLPGINVPARATPDAGSRQIGSEGQQARTVRRGAFQLRGLPAGPIVVSAENPVNRTATSAQVEIPQTRHVELHLNGYPALEITVLGPQGPVSGATISLPSSSVEPMPISDESKPESSEQWMHKMMAWHSGQVTRETDANGKIRLESVAPGSFQVQVKAKGLLSTFATITVRPGKLAEAQVVLSGGMRVSGRVVDADHQAVMGAEVSATGITMLSTPETRHVVSASGPDGTFDVGPLTPGPYMLMAKYGHAHSQRLFPRESVSGLELVMASDVEVIGRVVRTDGTPVAKLYVGNIEYATDAGRFEAWMPSFFHRFQISGDFAPQVFPFSSSSGRTDIGNVIVSPGERLEGVLFNENGEPAEGRVLCNLAQQNDATQPNPGMLISRAGSDGRFAFEHLPLVTLSCDGFVYSSQASDPRQEVRIGPGTNRLELRAVRLDAGHRAP